MPDLSNDAKVYLTAMLKEDEGWRQYVYTDIEGKLTIGWGHNLSDIGFTPIIGAFVLEQDMKYFLDMLPKTFNWYSNLSDVRKIVIINMCFNLGLKKLQEFHKMIAAIEMQDWKQAAREMLNSKWASQVGERATRLAVIMRTGELPDGTVF